MINRPVLVHYHIFKNAGSSVDFALQRSFGSRWATFEGRHAFDVQTSEQLGRFLENRPEVCAVSSHLARPPLPCSECRPIVFLRHPLLRVRSVQEFIRRNREQPGCPVVERSTLSNYVKWTLGSGRDEGGGVVCNYQVVHLSDASWRTHILKAKATMQDLDEAKSLIMSWGIVGIVEDYKKSTRRFQAAYAPQFPDLDFFDVRANRTSTEIPDVESQTCKIRDELGTELFERLVEANQLDIELYHWAVRRFGSAIAPHGDRGLPNVSASMPAKFDVDHVVSMAGSAEELKAEKLRDELRYLTTDLEALVRDRDELISQRDALVRVREGETVEHEALARRHNDLTTQHDVLAHAHNDLCAAHAELTRFQDAGVAEHQALAHAHNDLCAAHAELARVKNAEVAEQQALAYAHNDLCAAHAELAHVHDAEVAEHQALAYAHNNLCAAYAELARVHDAEVAERQALAYAHNGLCAAYAELARARDAEMAQYDTLARAYRSLVAEHDALARYSGDVIVQRDALLASHSWRLTAPLRWIRKLFAGPS